MSQSRAEQIFWNQPEMVGYFAHKDPDPRVVAALGLVTTKSQALDLGCGGGRHSQLLGSANFTRVVSLDINPAMIAATAHRTAHQPSVLVAYGGIEGIPLRDATCDFIVSTGVLHQARSIPEMTRAVRDIHRVARPGGIFIGNMFVSDVWDETYRIPDVTNPEFVLTTEDVGMTIPTSQQATELLEDAGFEFLEAPSVDFKLENTGPRGVYRFLTRITGEF